MFMIKFFPIFIFCSMSSFLILLMKNLNFSFSLNYLYNTSEVLNKLDLSFCLDYECILFLFMVLLVTSVVLVYSEFYMEHYNNYKFLVLTLSFFFSMAILSMSSSYLILMVGWDGLGLTSICLIMFYPNKMTMYNSSLTMFFNRLGDVILICILSLSLQNLSFFFFLIQDESLFMMVMLLMICSFTKSAQFPLSSWLPAAMSAPTPISAMVHSSTLVTAGIFLMNKLIFYLNIINLSLILFFFSSLTFILGGLMANLEKDFKKIVAFSTMSQISMIMYFCSINLLFLSLSHMVFHAFFKTLLFCCSGIIFVLKFSDQLSTKFNSTFSMNFISFMFFFSIFSMSGLTFSSSFFSKDLILEVLLSQNLNFTFLILMFGSFLTILYCSKLMNSSKSFFYKIPIKTMKSYFSLFFLIFCLISFFTGKWMKMFFNLEMNPVLTNFWVMTILMFLVLMMMIKLKFSEQNLMMFSYEISFMKNMFYSIFSKPLKNYEIVQISFSDHFFFKPKIFSVNTIKMTESFKMKKSLYLIMFVLILFYSFY